MLSGERLLRRRFFALTGVFAAVIGCLVLYLFWLQIVKGGEFRQRARDVSQRETPLPARRGEIFDRNGDAPLVFNVDSFAIDVVPGELSVAERSALFDRLARVLDMPRDEIQRRFPPKIAAMFQPVEVKGAVPFSAVSYIAEHMEWFKGVSWRNKPIRSYTESSGLAHVIGYVGDITREELQVLYNRGYTAGSVLGKSGIEKQYDTILRGKAGKKFRVVDVRERRLDQEEIEVVAPEPGLNAVLTIDRRIQEVCEQALGPRNGSVVVLKPATGEILALVSYPSFDPNLFFAPDSSAYFTGLSTDSSFPFLNRAIQSAYPPGSVFKIVLTTAIVEGASIPVTRAVRCTGKLEFGDRVFNCWEKKGHGYLDLFGGLAQSCDVYFFTMGNELGVDTIVSFARDYGLGSPTGIDLPEERAGFLPTPEWKQKARHMKWLGGDTLNLSIGQGFLTMSPLQMANMVAMVANAGVVYKPYVLKETRNPQTGTVVTAIAPEVMHTSAVSKETFRTVQEAMRGVITVGTAAPVITTRAVEVAGKTGTAEIGVEGRWHSWFAAYAPFHTDRPEERIVVVVMAEASDTWEWWAPKAANLIFQAVFAGQSFEDAVATVKPWYSQAIRRTD